LYYLFKGFGLVPFFPLIKTLAPLHAKIARASFHLNRIQNVLKGDHRVFQPNEISRLFNGDFHKDILKYSLPNQRVKGYFDDYYQFRNYHIDILQNINEVIVFKAARMAELFQQKLSFPYLGTDLYNFLKKKPREFKNKGSLSTLAKGQGISKYLLRSMLEKKLSSEITQKKKQGGFTPLSLFFGQKEITAPLIDYIQNATCTRLLMNKKYLDNHLSLIRKAGENNTMWFWTRQAIFNKAFNILVMCVWWDIFVENKKNIELINK
jgi:asparagine synthase (glutamine-hydrolysing)